MGMRGSWGCWATAKYARKITGIRTVNARRALNRSPRWYFRANSARRDRCALLLRLDLESCKQRCRADRGRPVHGCLRSGPCDRGVENLLDCRNHRTEPSPPRRLRLDCLFESAARCCTGHLRREWSNAGASRAQDLPQFFSNFLVLNEVPTIGRCHSEIDRLDKTSVIFEVMAQDLLGEFVCLQASLRGYLRQLRFFLGM